MDLLRQRRWQSAVLLLAATALLVGAHSVPLFDQDEAAYAGFARTMRTSGDWVLHAYPWSEMHRKPPLALWLMTASTQLLGESWLSLRLPGALCFAATCALLATWGARLFGRPRATTAAVILATSLAPVFGKIALVDPVLLLSETIAMLGVASMLDGRRWGALPMLVGVAMGLLAKGPAMVLFVGVAGATLVLTHPQRRRLVLPIVLLPLAALPLLMWGWRAWLADDGQTVRWMIDWYLLRRTGGSVLGQAGPPGTYLVTMLVFLLPWLAFLPAGLAAWWRRLREGHAVSRLLLAWLMGGWIVWELLPNKLPAYALGAYPALALVLADPLRSLVEGQRAPMGVRLGLVLQGLAIVGLTAGLVHGGLTLGQAGPVWGLIMAGLWLGLGAAVTLVALWRGRVGLGQRSGVLLAPGLLAILWLWGLPGLAHRLHPTWQVAQLVDDMAPEGAPVLVADAWRLPSLLVYLERQGRAVEIVSVDAAEESLSVDGEWTVVLPHAPETEQPGQRVGKVHAFVPDKGTPTTFVVVVQP